METLTYEQTIELEANIKIKNEAEVIYQNFLKNVKLEAKNYKGEGKFLFWSDEHNQTYFTIKNEKFVFQCRFLHETYDVEVTPSGIFNALKKEYRGVSHLSSAVRERQKLQSENGKLPIPHESEIEAAIDKLLVLRGEHPTR